MSLLEWCIIFLFWYPQKNGYHVGIYITELGCVPSSYFIILADVVLDMAEVCFMSLLLHLEMRVYVSCSLSVLVNKFVIKS